MTDGEKTLTENRDDRDDAGRRVLAAARHAIATHTRLVPDFPQPGIAFKDLTPVLADPVGLASVVTALTHECGVVDLVAGIDARGFLLAGAVARELGVGVLAVRKAGKLPPPVHSRSYDLEYGSAALEIPAGAVELERRRVLLIDDVLATGGTVVAAAKLLISAGATVSSIAVIMELAGLGGRAAVVRELGETTAVHTLTTD